MRNFTKSTPHRFPWLTGFVTVATTFLLFVSSCHKEEILFQSLAMDLFQDEMLSNTLNMHYTLADPESFGIQDYEVVLPCYSYENVLAGQTQTQNLLDRLKSLDVDKLSNQAGFTHALLIDSLENSLALSSLSLYEEPLSPSSGMQSQLPILLAEYTFRSVQDIEDYLKLLNQTDEYFEALLIFEQEKAAAGLLMSSSSIKKVVEQCDTILNAEELNAETHFLQTTFQERLQPLVENGQLSSEKAKSYTALNNRLLRTVMQPAYEALGDGLLVLEDPDIPLRGLASKPQGTTYYEHLLRSQTGSKRPVAEIKTMIAEHFDREYITFSNILTQTPSLVKLPYDILLTEQFPLQNATQMLAHLQTRMSDDFPPLNGANGESGESALPAVSVKTVSESLENYCAPAFYLTPPLDDTSQNAIYINKKSTPTGLELYTTLAHEGYPGHMYQSVYHNRAVMEAEPDAISNVRELLWYGGYLEGWALYVEFISYDYAAQMYTDRGNEELAAAVRLTRYNRSLLLGLYSLLDIMIHYENADREQTAALLANFGITNEVSVSAIYQYIVEEPTNYLKYYLGYLEILALKEQAQKLWGDAYTDLEFHTFLLESGPADFYLLEEALKNWPLPQLSGE
ncbi:MAG: DUF885 domain-containing protein [Lachnospiraceae bacterium]|nr:DUF885 domain-containing protein [Lachnospiraceae bacterium]